MIVGGWWIKGNWLMIGLWFIDWWMIDNWLMKDGLWLMQLIVGSRLMIHEWKLKHNVLWCFMIGDWWLMYDNGYLVINAVEIIWLMIEWFLGSWLLVATPTPTHPSLPLLPRLHTTPPLHPTASPLPLSSSSSPNQVHEALRNGASSLRDLRKKLDSQIGDIVVLVRGKVMLHFDWSFSLSATPSC